MEKTFNMKKNDVASLPASANSVVVGMGWSCSLSTDFDASVVCLDSAMNKKDIICFVKQSGSGIFHRGDNTSGAGSGDDERIKINFDQVPQDITNLFVTVNIYSGASSFGEVRDAYIRIC